MRFNISQIIFPEGDSQEISHRLRINQMVDINGNPLSLPLSTSKMIVYRVYKISTDSNRNEDITNYHLEQVSVNELDDFVNRNLCINRVARDLKNTTICDMIKIERIRNRCLERKRHRCRSPNAYNLRKGPHHPAIPPAGR